MKLQLICIQSEFLKIGSTFNLRPQGFVGVWNEKKNGVVYVGNEKGKNEILIDDPCIGARNTIIKYVEKGNQYQIMDLS